MWRFEAALVGAGVAHVPHPDGQWVRYDDAKRAVAEAEQRGLDAIAAHGDRVGAEMYQQGQRDERARIRAAVEALNAPWADHGDIDEDCRRVVLAIIDAGGES